MGQLDGIPMARLVPMAEALDVPPALRLGSEAGALGTAGDSECAAGAYLWTAAASAAPFAQPVPAAIRISPPKLSIPPLRVPTDAGLADLGIVVGVGWGVEFVLGLTAGVIGVLSVRSSGAALPWAVAAANVFVTAMCWVFACRKYGRSLCDGLALRRVGVLTVLGSIALGGILGVAAHCLVTIFPPAEDVEMVNAFVRWSWLGLIVFVPPFEETYYRGFLFTIFHRLTGPVGAVLIVAAWFAMAHVGQFVAAPITIPVLTSLSVVLTLQRARTGSIVPSILTHWTYNAMILAVPLLAGE